MILENMTIKNFLGIGSGEINFDATGLTLIEGVNEDSPSSVSNGAGKSSVFEALYWVLFGKTKRGVSGDGVINEKEGKNCRVTLTFRRGGARYFVARTRKCEHDGTHLKLDSEESGGLTKGTIKETQALLESIIGMSELTFSKATYFGQEDVKAFAALSDAELKKVFEQSLGLTYFSEWTEKVKETVRFISNAVEDLNAKIAIHETSMKGLREKKKVLEKSGEDLKARKVAEIARLVAEADELERRLDEVLARKSEAELYVTTRSEDAEEHKRKLAALEVEQERNKAQVELYRRKVEKADTEIGMEKRQLSEMLSKAKALKERIGGPCGECGKVYEEGDIRPALMVQKKALEKKSAHVKMLVRASESYRTLLSDSNDKVIATSIGIKKLKEGGLDDLVRSIEKARDGIITASKEVKRLWADIGDKKRAVETVAKTPDGYAEEIDAVRAEIAATNAEVKGFVEDIDKLTADLSTAKILVEILGNGGMKSYIFDHVTPSLNKNINEFAAVLDDIEIEVSTVKKLKSGDFREKFSIVVNNPYGAKAYEGNSGGEKAKVNLSIAMGFNKTLREITDGVVNCIFLDEPFESLDEGSSERVLELCGKFADVGNVFLITHNPNVKELIPDVIQVKKKDGAAHIKPVGSH